MGVIAAAVQELRQRVDESARVIGGPPTLTSAELRILPLLSTHLTFEEIGDRMGVSRHTVKSHVMAIYGKLGPSRRSEAMTRSVEIGLLEPYAGFRLIPPEG